jgi:hypothetical protein
MKKLAVFATLLIASQAYAERWVPYEINDPANFINVAQREFEYDVDQLPLEGKLADDRLGWSDTYWPSNKGGIAYRWNSPNPQPFRYRFYSKSEIMSMSEAQLAELSPAELYDISRADYKYGLTKQVLKTYTSDDLWWEGICHGWALAAVNYPEPDKTVVVNKDGVRVPFGSSDVKALLSMHDAFNSNGAYSRVGGVCKGVEGKVPGEAFPEDGNPPEPSEEDSNTPDCRDTNAGAFHVVITNMIGRFSKGFVADVDRYNDIWNQPVSSYQSKIVGEVAVTPRDQRYGITRKLQVQTEMNYGDELEFYSAEEASKGTLGFVSKDPVTGTSAQTVGTKKYEYILEMDSKNKIVGGEWISKSRPDFLWSKTKDVKFNNKPGSGTGFARGFFGGPKVKYELEGLNLIYRPIQR